MTGDPSDRARSPKHRRDAISNSEILYFLLPIDRPNPHAFQDAGGLRRAVDLARHLSDNSSRVMQGRDSDRCTDRTDFHETAARKAHLMRQSVELGHYRLPL